MERILVKLPEMLRPQPFGDLIRLGHARDGGYVIPRRCLLATDVLLSFGLSANWEFEKDFRRARESLGKPLLIHAYDHTINATKLGRYRLKALLHLIASRDPKHWKAWRMAGGYRRFFDGVGAVHFEEMVTWCDGPGKASVDAIMSRIDRSSGVFLSMDIEGHEYRVAGDLIRHADRFVGMAIEFHDLDILRDRFMGIHELLLGPFALAHVHVNNVLGLGREGFPNILEMTYVARRLVRHDERAAERSYPVEGLDMANVPGRPDFQIAFE